MRRLRSSWKWVVRVSGALFLVLVGLLSLSGLERTAAVGHPGGELVIGVAKDQYRLEGDAAALGVYPLNANITETLVRLTPDFQIVPWLATSWEYVGENTWRFTLRQGVKFHNGDEMDAEAVKWSLAKQQRFQPLFPAGEEDIRVVDKYTIEITTRWDFRRVVEALTHPSYAIYSPKGDPGRNPIGTGPYRLVEYRQNETLVVERFADYWNPEAAARMDRLVFRFIPDGSTRILALQAGQVDLITPVPRENAAALAGQPGITVYQAPANAYYALYFATKDQVPPYDTLTDPRVRKAINYAIDRETIVEQIYSGFAEVAKTLTPPAVLPEVDAGVEGFAFDPGRVAELLTEAGYTRGADGFWQKDGEPLALTLVSGFPPASIIKPLPEVIQAMLEDQGIRVRLVEFDDIGAYYDYVDTGELHMVIESGSWNMPDPSFIPFGLFCSCNTEGEAILYKRFWINEAFEQEVMRMVAAEDRAEVVEAAVRAAQIMVDEFTGVGPIAYIPNLIAARDEVQGVVVHPAAVHQRWTGMGK